MTEKEIQLLNQIKCIPGFEDVEASDEGYEKLDAKLDEIASTCDDLAIDSTMLEKVTMKAKINDLNREVTLTFQTQDDATFKVLAHLAPIVELLPLLAKLDMLPEGHFGRPFDF